MTRQQPDEKDIAFAHRVRKLHEILLRGGTEAEQKAARQKLEDLLAERRMTMSDVAELIVLSYNNPRQSAPVDDDDDGDGTPPPPPSSALAACAGKQPDVFELVDWALGRFLFVEDHQRTAITLWILHTHLYDQFQHSPRLVLISPVRECGKSTVFHICKRLCRRANEYESLTAAALTRLIHSDRGTMLLDEADNTEFAKNLTLRAVLNAGFEAGAKRALMSNGVTTKLEVYTPVALATIGRRLPLPLMSRSVVINMVRAPRGAKIERFDPCNRDIIADLDVVYRHILVWAQGMRGKLDTDPKMPTRFHGRLADRWRALFSIADALGYGDQARKAAEVFAGEHPDEDMKVLLLGDIYTVFGTDTQLGGAELLERLLALESDAGWQEFRGENGEQAPKPLTQPALTKMVSSFNIRKRTLWPKPRTAVSRSYRGYYRHQFEQAWASYCDIGDTATQASRVRRLAGI
jgi:hypothetical protein